MGTSDRADKFYDEQVLDRLNPRMREFAARQEMFFLATSDIHGECDNTFRAALPASSRSATTGRWFTPSIAAMASLPASETFRRIRTSAFS
ncbi:hypothetical protein ACFQ0G_09845 [Streptomyces chiangmaiensis]